MWKNGITKCVRLVGYKVWQNGLQSVLGVGLQSMPKWITKCARDYKVWQGVYELSYDLWGLRTDFLVETCI